MCGSALTCFFVLFLSSRQCSQQCGQSHTTTTTLPTPRVQIHFSYTYTLSRATHHSHNSHSLFFLIANPDRGLVALPELVCSQHGVVPVEPLARRAPGDSLEWDGKAAPDDCARLCECTQDHASRRTAVSIVASERGYTFRCTEHGKDGELHLLPPKWRALVFPKAVFFSQERDAPDNNPLAIFGLLDATVSNPSTLLHLRDSALEQYDFEGVVAPFLREHGVAEGEIKSLKKPCSVALSFVRDLSAKLIRV